MMEDKKQQDFLWKIVLTGDSFVGKTTIRKRAMGEHFAEEYISTVGADFSSYKLKLGDLTIGFQVWDLAGQDKYKYIRSSFYGGATGCFLVFDVTNPKSMKNLSSWVDEAIRYSNGTIEIFIICANKIDLKSQREITREMGERYAQALRESSGLQCEYIETSALTGENIDVAFDVMAKCLLEREGISPIKTRDEIPIVEQPTEPLITQEESVPPIETITETTKVVDTVPSTTKSLMIEDDVQEETERLIAEVMTVLDETDEIIIGREMTKDGERVITTTKSAIEEQPLEEESEPKISSELENVLVQINSKLDSLTTRLKDLEEEISQAKTNDFITKPIDEEIIEEEEVEDESINILSQLPPPTETPTPEPDESEELDEIDKILPEPDVEEVKTPIEEPEVSTIDSSLEQITEDEKLDQDQKVLESLLETLPEPDEPIEEEIKDSPSIETSDTNSTSIESLTDLPDNELIDIPEDEPLIPIYSDDDEPLEDDDSVIGTELSSAMISELKDMSKLDETEDNKTTPQPLTLDTSDKKHTCPICGEETKYIRQYKKHYCVKCGRYII
jgi:small GTP-binding protein